MEHKSRTSEEHKSKALQMLKAGGHPNVKAEIAKAVHEHEKHDHPGEGLTKLAKGGKVGKDPGVAVIVHTGPDQEAQRAAMHQGMQAGAIMGAKAARQQPPTFGAPPPGALPMAQPGPGAVPPSGPVPGMPPRPAGLKRGGAVDAPDQAGAAGGMGRLQKVKSYGASGPVGGAPETVKVKGYIRRKHGGECE